MLKGPPPCLPSPTRAIYYGPDTEGINGIYLGKNVVTEASKGLTKAMWAIAPKVSTSI